MSKSAEQILVALYNQMEYDGHGWWLKEIGLGEGDDPPSYEEFYAKLEKGLFSE